MLGKVARFLFRESCHRHFSQLEAFLRRSLMFGAAFAELAARDATVHKLMMEIRSLLKPYSALTSDAALMQRIQTVMVEMAQAEMGATAAV